MPVEIVHFNPRRRRPGLLGRVLPKRPLNNFGDVAGPLLIKRIIAAQGLTEPSAPHRLVAVGSIMRLAHPGDVVWGTGINGKTMAVGGAPDLDVRAVRGPLTRGMLIEAGTAVPEVYGDPALLWPRYFPREAYETSRRPVTVIPNYNDLPRYKGVTGLVDPRSPITEIVSAIVSSDFVCGTSLHAIVFAEAYGVPARLIRSNAEPPFKYDDYYAGTGRPAYRAAETVDEALSLGGESPLEWDGDALLEAFPTDLWRSE